MESLIAHLETPPFDRLPKTAQNEFIQMWYRFLHDAVAGQSDQLQIDSQAIQWVRDAHVIGQFPMTSASAHAAFVRALEALQHHDPIVAGLLQAQPAPGGVAIYQLVCEPHLA